MRALHRHPLRRLLAQRRRKQLAGWRSGAYTVQPLERRWLLAGVAALFKDINPGTGHALTIGFDSFATVNGTFYFDASDGLRGNELWKSDGTATNTTMVADLAPGSPGSFPFNLTDVNGVLFFTTGGSGGGPLWASDGTAANTFKVPNAPPAATSLINADGKLFFQGVDSARGSELWVLTSSDLADVRAAFTVARLTDDNPGPANSKPRNFTLSQDQTKLFFTSRNDTAGRRIWISDGTAFGTTAGGDINTGPVDGFDDTFPDNLTTVGNTAYFRAYDASVGEELFKSDGSPSGTGIVSNIAPGGATSSPEFLATVRGKVVFQAFQLGTGIELFVHDPLLNTTQILKDINQKAATFPPDGSTQGSNPQFMTVVNNVVFFNADDGVSSSGSGITNGLGELWKTDGTAAGTVLVKDINTTIDTQGVPAGSAAGNFDGHDGLLYFTADDESHGNELWQSDGTNAGTVRISDITPDAGGPFPLADGAFGFLNGQLFLTVSDSAHGAELWSVKDPDADADGLPDRWESNGIDYNMDGKADLTLPGANPNHKDIFIEVDYMQAAGHDHRPLDAAIQDVITAFAGAPVSNPDGINGIAIHVSFATEDPISEVTPLAFDARRPGPTDDFQDLKLAWFGTAAQRGAANAEDVLGAKKFAYRYDIFGHDHLDEGSSGFAELPGNDFIVTLASWSAAAITDAGGQEQAEAGTFQHELGHTLNLRHGGGDDDNFKTNYFSVMNYSYQMRSLDPTRPLDYSRQALGALDETALDETVGIGGPTAWQMVYGIQDDAIDNQDNNDNGIIDRTIRVEPANQASVDWNGDGIPNDNGVNADPNFLQRTIDNSMPPDGVGDRLITISNASPDQRLRGFNDWANIRLNFRDSFTFRDGATQYGAGGTPHHEPELTAQNIIDMKAAVSGGGGGGGNHAPVLGLIGNRSVNEGSTLSFTASASDVDAGQSRTFSLAAGAPAGAVINAATGAFTFTPRDGPATFNLTVRVMDNGSPNLSDSETIAITVKNVPPMANAGPDQSGLVGKVVSLAGKFTDPGTLDTHAFKWHVVASNGQSIADGTAANFTFTPSAAGTYTATFTVTDKDGGVASDNVVVTVSSSTGAQKVTVFTLINAATDKDIRALKENDVIALVNTGEQLNIRASTLPGTVGSVRFVLDGVAMPVETFAPYALFGDDAGNYKAGTFSRTFHTLTATPFSGGGGTGMAGTPLTLHFRVILQPFVSHFTLLDANKNVDLFTLNNNATIDLSKLPVQLSIRANTVPTLIGSVRLSLDGTFINLENFGPYTLFGDNNGDYVPGNLAVGAHVLTATPFSGIGGGGRAFSATTIMFKVIRS